MPLSPPFGARALDPHDRAEAIALTVAAGCHGVYVRNALHDGTGETLGFYGTDALLGLCWFGPRGNLILVEREPLDGRAVAAAVRDSRWPWRIALGPAAAVDALRASSRGRPLVHRDQLYFAGTEADAARDLVRGTVRAPGRDEAAFLEDAALQLNESDLCIDPRRVDRAWLRETVLARIAEGSTRVLGPVGGIVCKLDFGSDGPGGLVLEGVFTPPLERGRGHATALVASVLAAAPGPVCLHVAAQNTAARAAYVRAGLRPAGACRLLLL